MRLSQYANGRVAIWLRGVVFTLTMDEAEELFDKLGMLITGLTIGEIEEVLREGG
jgi:hypothetical protein